MGRCGADEVRDMAGPDNRGWCGAAGAGRTPVPRADARSCYAARYPTALTAPATAPSSPAPRAWHRPHLLQQPALVVAEESDFEVDAPDGQFFRRLRRRPRQRRQFHPILLGRDQYVGPSGGRVAAEGGEVLVDVVVMVAERAVPGAAAADELQLTEERLRVAHAAEREPPSAAQVF